MHLFASATNNTRERFMQRVGRGISLAVVFFALVSVSMATAQNAANDSSVTFTAEQDHQNMMDQLGIKQVRPGPSGDESAPNHANYDPATANLFPNYPDALTMSNGHEVTGHTDAPNIKYFIQWADRFMKAGSATAESGHLNR
jgi:hypothetical protein